MYIHSLFGYLNKSTSFLQASFRNIENLINRFPNKSGGLENFSKKTKRGDAYLGP